MNIRYLLYILFLFSSGLISGKIIQSDYKSLTNPPFTDSSSKWVDSVFNSLTIDEKIAQLFIAPAWSNKKCNIDELTKLIKDNKIGGLIFMQGGPVKQAILTNYYQSISKVPLFISIDAEWGLSMRLDSVLGFPKQMMLGALNNDILIYEMGKEIAYQCERMGIQINYAPDIDINNNPLNPVIGRRSFSENKIIVVNKAYQYMQALQNNHIIAVGKHFPGHGNTDSDSHLDLPVVYSSFQELDSTELYPFKKLIDKGISGIMIGHLSVPAIDSTINLPSTLSPKIIKKLLKSDMGFKGLVFTDALNMKGISKYFKPGDVEVKALIAGNDIILFSEDIPLAICKIEEELECDEISIKDINDRCKKVLAAKYWAGLNKIKPVNLKNLNEDINSQKALLLRRKLIENSLTLVKNENNLIPFLRLDTLKIASLALGEIKQNTFHEVLGLYADVKPYNIPHNYPDGLIDSILTDISKYNLVIISIHSSNSDAVKNFSISDKIINIVNYLSSRTNVVLDIFGTPYCLSRFDDLNKIKSILVSYDDYDITNNLSAQLLFGGILSKGTLPVTASKDFKSGTGIMIKDKIRLKYSIPEELGIDNKYLTHIDSLVSYAINKKAFPGCQIIVAKDGIVFYHKSFGYYTYDNIDKVTNDDLYDLASLTKVFASTLSLMKLCDENKFEITNKLSDYIPNLKSTNKKNILIEDVLTHQAKLIPWIPFYLRTIKNDTTISYFYKKNSSDLYSLKVADSLYLRKNFRDTIYNLINESELLKKKEYKYSDLGFYYMQLIIEKISGLTLDNYVYYNFYKPIGAATLGYKPLEHFSANKIAPTENDKVFRKQVLNGYVHDQGAALLGGVGGHAGLFSNSNDLLKIMQMLLQNGQYGGKKYLNEETINLFTTCRFCPLNRRGIGFDKPAISAKFASPACKCVSQKSFGHTGFTGTFAWADPENQLIYIFLSNRVYPDADNNLIIDLNTRTKIQEVIYNALKK